MITIVGILDRGVASFDLNNAPPDLVVPALVEVAPQVVNRNALSFPIVRLPGTMTRAEGEARVSAALQALAPAGNGRPRAVRLRPLRDVQVQGGQPNPTGNSLVEKELLMIAQGRTLKLLRLTGIVGVITGIAMSIADISLLYSSAGGYESDAVLLTIPMWRLLLGHYLGVLMLPFYLIAIWHLYEGIKPGGAWLSIPVAALLGYVAAAGGAFHGSIAGLALIVQAGVGASPETQTVLTHLLANAHQFVEPLQAVVFLAGFVGSLWLGAAILSGHTAYPRWFVLANPVLVHAVLFASYVLTPNPVSTLLLPATASLSLLILFGFSTALLWNGGREPQRGGQTAFAAGAGG